MEHPAHRGKYAIIADTLRAMVDGPRKKTHLIHESLHNNEMADRYLELMLDSDVVIKRKDNYHISRLGRAWLKRYDKMVKVVGGDHW